MRPNDGNTSSDGRNIEEYYEYLTDRHALINKLIENFKTLKTASEAFLKHKSFTGLPYCASQPQQDYSNQLDNLQKIAALLQNRLWELDELKKKQPPVTHTRNTSITFHVPGTESGLTTFITKQEAFLDTKNAELQQLKLRQLQTLARRSAAPAPSVQKAPQQPSSQFFQPHALAKQPAPYPLEIYSVISIEQEENYFLCLVSSSRTKQQTNVRIYFDGRLTNCNGNINLAPNSPLRAPGKVDELLKHFGYNKLQSYNTSTQTPPSAPSA